MDRIFTRSRRGVVVVTLGVIALAGTVPAAASASAWSPAARLTTSGAPFSALGVGAFAEPDGSFVLSGYSNFHSVATGAGNTTGFAGGVFPAPSGPVITNAVSLPDGSSLVAFGGSFTQHRAADGTLQGSAQTMAGNVGALGVDSAGNATAVGVLNSGSFTLNVYSRAAGASSFTESPTPIATSGAGTQMTLVGLAVDPNGAAVVTFLAGATTLWQATRAAGAPSFGPAAVLANDATNGVAPNGASFASNAAGRAVVVYYTGGGYSAAIRNPGGAFAAPVNISGALTSTVPNSVSAVAADGSAATLVGGTTAAPGCGTFYSQHAYGLPAAGTTWTSSGVFGGTDGDSVAHPALAGGPGNRIDAAWSVDTRSDAQLCGPTDAYQIQAGTLGGQMATIFTGNPPTFLPGPTTYGNAYSGGSTPALALNACGAGALIVGIGDASNNDTHDGLFTSTTAACPAVATKPANTAPPAASGKTSVGQKLSASTGTWSGTAPIGYAYQWQRCKPTCANIAGANARTYTLATADQGASVRVTVTASNAQGSASANSSEVGPIGPSPAAIKALLAKLLTPHGEPAKLSAILKHRGYPLSFTAPSAGKVTISWYLVPKGAHLAAAKPQLIAGGTAKFGKAGKVTLLVKLSAKGKQLLKHSHHLKLTAKGAYTPSGGTAVTTTKAITLKG